MIKLSVAGVVRELLDSQPGVTFDLPTLYAACVAAGLEVTEVQVYAGVQVMASTGKAARGDVKRTWRSVTVPKPTLQVVAKVVKRTRKVVEQVNASEPVKRKVAKVINGQSDDEVLAKLTELLGPPSTKPATGLSLYFMLDGTQTAEYIISRSKDRLNKADLTWYTMRSQQTVIVALPL